MATMATVKVEFGVGMGSENGQSGALAINSKGRKWTLMLWGPGTYRRTEASHENCVKGNADVANTTKGAEFLQTRFCIHVKNTVNESDKLEKIVGPNSQIFKPHTLKA